MSNSARPPLLTAADLLARPDDFGRCELVAGEVLTMAPSSPRREVWICRADGEVVILKVGEALTDPLLPGFSLPLSELFEE